MNPVVSLGLAVTSLSLTAVSIACEVALFVGFAKTDLDQTLAAVTGAGLVASQFLLVAVLQDHIHHQRKALATWVFLLIALLLTISVAGTAAWLETRYQEQHQVSLKSTQEHQLVSQLLEDFKTQANSLREQAVFDRNTGNHWRAGERLKEAALADEQRIKALAMLSNVKSVPQSSGQSLASENNALRWGLWVILAALVDLCPLLGFASLRNTQKLPARTQAERVLSSETPDIPESTPLPVKAPVTPKSVTPDSASSNSASSNSASSNSASSNSASSNSASSNSASSNSASSNSVSGNSAAVKTTSFSNASNNNAATKPPPICCHGITDHQALLQEEMNAGVYPEGPTIRALMKRHHVGFQKAKKILRGYEESSKARMVA